MSNSNTRNEAETTVVFLSHNRQAEVLHTLDVLTELRKAGEVFDVLVIDNASTDGTREMLNSRQPQDFTRLLLDTNTAVGAYLDGALSVDTPYLFILDDDSHPLHGAIAQTEKLFATEPDIGAIACRIEDLDGQRQRSWHLPEKDHPQESFSFIGCGFAVKRELFINLGGFAEDLFIYQNEIDFSFHLQRLGHKIWFLPTAAVVHREAAITCQPAHRRIYYPTRNTLLVIRRHFCGFLALYMVLSRLCIGFCAALLYRAPLSYLSGAYDGLTLSCSPVEVSLDLSQAGPFFKENSILHLGRHFRKVLN